MSKVSPDKEATILMNVFSDEYNSNQKLCTYLTYFVFQSANVSILMGPVWRPGALGSFESVYFRDPDDNLLEISKYPHTIG